MESGFSGTPTVVQRWPPETSIQSKKAKYFCTHPTLQNGGSAYVERQSQARGLVIKNRSERCIFHDPSSSSGQEVPEISKSREDISIQVPTTQPIQCTLGLYQDPMFDSDPPKRIGSSDGFLYRRHTGDGRIRSTIKKPCSVFTVPTQEPGVHHQ